GGELFRARYDTKAPALEDISPALDRGLLLRPSSGDPAAAAGEVLYRELFTSLGREAEALRDEKWAQAPPPPAAFLQTAGGRALLCPGRRVLGRAVRRLSAGLLERWAREEPQDLGPAIRQALLDRLGEQRLDPPGALADLQADWARRLGKAPAETAAGWREALAPAAAPWLLDLPRVHKVLRQMDQFLGNPEEEGMQPAAAPVAAREAAEAVGLRGQGLLAGLIADYLERPGHRLGAA